MRYELVSLVLVLAVAGGLLLGTGTSGGFFSAIFSPAQSSDDSQLSGDNVKGVDTSGFKVNIKASGSKTTGDDGGTDGQTDEIEEVTSPPITGMAGGGGSGGGKKVVPDDDPGEGQTSPTASVSVDVPDSVSNGSSFSVDVEIDTDARVYAIEITLEYDKAVLNATEVEEGSFLGSNSDPITLKIDNDAGTVEYINTRINPQEGREPGEGTLLTVTFEALAAKDKTSITITKIEVVDENVDRDNPVIVSIEDGELGVE